MVKPNDAVNAAIAATSSHDQDPLRKDRPGSSPWSHRRTSSGSPSTSVKGHLSSEAGQRADVSDMIVEELTASDSPATTSSPGFQRQRWLRPRKGSLRKSALLGTHKFADGKERHRSGHLSRLANDGVQDQVQSTVQEEIVPSLADAYVGTLGTRLANDVATPKPLPVPPPVPMVTHPVHGDPSRILEVTDAKEPFPPELKQRSFTAPQSSTASTTTDDDDSISSYPTSDIIRSAQALQKPGSADSYFPVSLTPSTQSSSPSRLLSQLSKTSSLPKSRSPLGSLPPSIPASPPSLSDWDYSETRWWGWFILCVTWIVFVIGMGSCFSVWSWAWDVGETPYAPPELEDDPTLPIIGYYPALLVLTCVMAWVWVTGAWVGMKYFRHANISGDDD